LCVEPVTRSVIVESVAVYSLIVPLVLMLGAGVATVIVLRRWRGSIGRREGPLQLVHVIALGPRERLALVKVGDRYLVVGITPSSISRVAELDAIADEAAM
jgi:flagellar protein FliO/FliZ